MRAKISDNLLKSDFEIRGQELRNGFSKRYGGGFPASSEIAETFSDDAGDMVKKVVSTDTKTINDMIAASLSEKIKEETTQTEEPAATYTRPDDITAETQMSPEQVEQLFSDMAADQETAKRAVNTSFSEDSPVKNIAAALQTTEDATLTGLDGFGLDPQTLQAILDATKQAVPDITPTVTEEPTQSNISGEFSDLVDKVFGDSQEVPEDYKLSKVNVTYTKVEPEPEEEEDDDEQIESIDVTGKIIDNLKKAEEELDDEQIESIDVKGRIGDEEEIDSIDVKGRIGDDEEIEDIDVEGKLRDEDEIKDIDVEGRMRDEEDEEPTTRRGDEEESYVMNPWEKFKRLYADFYTGGQGAEVLKSFNRREAAGEFDGEDASDAIRMAAQEYEDMSTVTRDTNEILRAKDEKDQMMAFNDMMRDDVREPPSKPVIINSNKTIMARPKDEARTEKVFQDDNTFNRLSMADSNHPQYTGYR